MTRQNLKSLQENPSNPLLSIYEPEAICFTYLFPMNKKMSFLKIIIHIYDLNQQNQWLHKQSMKVKKTNSLLL